MNGTLCSMWGWGHGSTMQGSVLCSLGTGHNTLSLLGHPSKPYASLQFCANLHPVCEYLHAHHGIFKWEATLVIQKHSEIEL